jgi:hypothetical protein
MLFDRLPLDVTHWSQVYRGCNRLIQSADRSHAADARRLEERPGQDPVVPGARIPPGAAGATGADLTTHELLAAVVSVGPSHLNRSGV